MSYINDGLTAEQMGNTEAGAALLEKKAKLDEFGVDDGKFERTPIVIPSVVYFEKDETLSRKEFFVQKNRVS